MPFRRWNRTLAAGLLLTGAEAPALAQPPSMLPLPSAQPPGPVCAPNWVAPAVPLGGTTKAFARGSLLHYSVWPETPLGYSVALHYQTHITNGVASRMMLYDYDFVRGGTALNHRGKDRLRQIAGWAANNPFPVVVEWLPQSPTLAESRRAAVLTELTALLGRIPPERVVVAGPTTLPLQGFEAEKIYLNLLKLTETYGTQPPTGALGTGQTIGGGGGGGGGGAGSSAGSSTGGQR